MRDNFILTRLTAVPGQLLKLPQPNVCHEIERGIIGGRIHREYLAHAQAKSLRSL